MERIPEPISYPIEPKTMEYVPSKVEALRRYNISIKFLDRGVMVTVGCKEIAFESIDTFMKSFSYYMEQPYKAQTEWENIFKQQDQTK